MKKRSAFNKHFDLYMAGKRKSLLLLLVASIIFTIISWAFMYPRSADYSWFALAIMLPWMVKYFLTARAATKFARKKAKG